MASEEVMEYQGELDRLHHDRRCDILDCDRGEECALLPCGCPKPGYQCPCGCQTTIICPSKELCRESILHMTGVDETKAVRAWMNLGLCICRFVVKNNVRRHRAGKGMVPNKEYTKLSGNWSAKRRRKLVRCPCGAYFDNATVRAMALLSESEWKRLGNAKFKPGPKYYIDEETAKWKSPFICLKLPDGSLRPLTHVRTGPPPVARIWRPFYDFASKHFEAGIYSVDLFSIEQIDTSRREMSIGEAKAIVDSWFPGDPIDDELEAAIRQHIGPSMKPAFREEWKQNEREGIEQFRKIKESVPNWHTLDKAERWRHVLDNAKPRHLFRLVPMDFPTRRKIDALRAKLEIN